MYIHGSFTSQQGDTVAVYIVTKGDRTQTLEIGTDAADVYFSEDPVEITNEENDTFDVLLRQSATVRLLCGSLISDLFCTSCRDAVVNVYKGDRCVFAGFIEPQTFSQPYNERWDEIELNCVDALSALQYSKYRNIGSAGVDYSTIKASAEQRSFLDILKETMLGVVTDLDIVGGHSTAFWYDGSKAIYPGDTNRYSIFGQFTVSELLFLGDDEDDVWQQDEVLTEVLKYLNLHITQEGFDFYIFSWETVKNPSYALSPNYTDGSRRTKWQDLVTGDTTATPWSTVTISLDNVADAGATVSIGDTYNQLLLTCNVEANDTLLESPLDEDYLTSPYTNKQKYMTEYSSGGMNNQSFSAFYNMVHGEKTTFGEGEITDWYVRVMRNQLWDFPGKLETSSGIITVTDLVDYFCGLGTNQHALPYWLGENTGACVLSLGSAKTSLANKDNSPTKVEMTNCMVVSVNGNGKDSESETYPKDTDILGRIPYAIYNGNSAGGAFSPADDDTTNYIVISGKVILNPIMAQTEAYTTLYNNTGLSDGTVVSGQKIPKWGDLDIYGKVVPSRDNKNGRYYTRQYWKAEKPSDDAAWFENFDSGFYPYTGTGPEQYEFKYSAIGDREDHISKVSVLACMLVIGSKCVVETGTEGKPSDFEWRTFKERSECDSDDEYYNQCFTIGFDPKIGDKLIGTEFDIQDNITDAMNVDAEGTAIPIKKSDKVSGQVRFMILGPVNVGWGNVTRKPATWYRWHAKWSESEIPLMAHVSSILVKSFEVKAYSDNGGISNGSNGEDIVYMSDTEETFVNKKDDIEFKINSALTTEECKQLGVTPTANISTPWNTYTDEGVLEIYDENKSEKAKPEQIYVDRYYTEYHEPRLLLKQNLYDKDSIVNRFNHYRHEALGKDFFVQGISRNLIEGSAKLTLKEIES